jgi:hypothetical protein
MLGAARIPGPARGRGPAARSPGRPLQRNGPRVGNERAQRSLRREMPRLARARPIKASELGSGSSRRGAWTGTSLRGNRGRSATAGPADTRSAGPTAITSSASGTGSWSPSIPSSGYKPLHHPQLCAVQRSSCRRVLTSQGERRLDEDYLRCESRRCCTDGMRRRGVWSNARRACCGLRHAASRGVCLSAQFRLLRSPCLRAAGVLSATPMVNV